MKHAKPETDNDNWPISSFCQLRITTNKNGFRGVWWEASKKRYCAAIGGGSKHNKRKRLGSFKTAKDAAIAYDNAARERYGIHARLNFPNENEIGILTSQRPRVLCPHGHELAIHGYDCPDGTINCRICNAYSQRERKKRNRLLDLSRSDLAHLRMLIDEKLADGESP